MRKYLFRSLLASVCLILAACGGGGGGSSSSGSASSGGSSGGTTTPQNTQAIYVDAGPTKNAINEVFTTITLCSTINPSNCQTIDHILVDTGSYGLRVMSSVLSPTLNFNYVADTNGNILTECAQFADGSYTWGPLTKANLSVGAETASNLSFQIIGDTSSIPGATSQCSQNNTLIADNTVQSFGSNGVLGVGPFLHDCGTACASSSAPGFYYSCSRSACQPVTVATSSQLTNPVSLFPVDNNGVIISLPSVPLSGSTSVSGTMTFGIGTQTNNGLGSAKVITLNGLGQVTTNFNNNAFTSSFFDSGSNANFFNGINVPTCTSGFYCPSSVQSLTATVTGKNGTNSTIQFQVGNIDALYQANSALAAFGQSGAPYSGDTTSFDFGLPFFYGRTVFNAIENQSTPGGLGPYIAF